MLVNEEGQTVVKVLDFGLAKAANREGEDAAELTVSDGFVGTPHFASPERLEEQDIDVGWPAIAGKLALCIMYWHPRISSSVCGASLGRTGYHLQDQVKPSNK